jgi:hypothetical protein
MTSAERIELDSIRGRVQSGHGVTREELAFLLKLVLRLERQRLSERSGESQREAGK